MRDFSVRIEYENEEGFTSASDFEKCIGYKIADGIMPYICDFGKNEFDIDVKLVERKNLVYPDGNYDEINIYAEGIKKVGKFLLSGNSSILTVYLYN